MRYVGIISVLLCAACTASPAGGTLEGVTEDAFEYDAPTKNKAVDTADDAGTPDEPAHGRGPVEPPIRFVPSVDANAHLMARIDVSDVHEHTFSRPGYYNEAVPRLVHRVLWPGERPGAWPEHAAWRSYCDTMGYQLMEWDPAAAAEAGLQPSSVRAQAFVAAHKAGRPEIATQLTALAVLARHGGFLIGPRVSPPRLDGCSFDLQDMGARQGLTITTNMRARRVDGWSVYLTTAFVAASPKHPWVVAASAGAASNTLALLHSDHADLPGRYFAGNAYLSRNLAGIFSILPFTYLQDIGMFPLDFDLLSEDDALE